ncbi:hypothetical protein [Deinococcus hohokamensis]|uniref:Uncharacterized protein n=1 Tax=Deinococcus hohokamensis TaxID=309883 RepID=A0ABV9IF74_9DEIO
MRYDDLRVLMDYPTNQPLTSILNNVMQYCRQHGLPPLTIIVVNQAGVPGAGFSIDHNKPPYKEQEAVFAQEWFKLIPPTAAEFQAAMAWSKTLSAD